MTKEQCLFTALLPFDKPAAKCQLKQKEEPLLLLLYSLRA